MSVGGFSEYSLFGSVNGESSVFAQNIKLLKRIEIGQTSPPYVSGDLEPPTFVYVEPILKKGKSYIRWSAVPCAERYRVYRYIDNPNKAKAINLDVVGTELENENYLLYHLANYKCFVQAVTNSSWANTTLKSR